MSKGDLTRLRKLVALTRLIDRKAVLDVEGCSQAIREAQSAFDEKASVLASESAVQQAFADRCVSHLSAAKKAMRALEEQRVRLQSTAIAARAQNRGVERLIEANDEKVRRAQEVTELESALVELLHRTGDSYR